MQASHAVAAQRVDTLFFEGGAGKAAIFKASTFLKYKYVCPVIHSFQIAFLPR
jgi:hypothetical protein